MGKGRNVLRQRRQLVENLWYTKPHEAGAHASRSTLQAHPLWSAHVPSYGKCELTLASGQAKGGAGREGESEWWGER